DAAERVAFARICQGRGWFAAAARHWEAALAAQPEPAAFRPEAARAAAFAAAGAGKHDPQPEEQERRRWRRQALRSVRTEPSVGGPSPPGGSGVIARLQERQCAPALKGLREPAALAELPAADREAWGKLWAEVAALRTQLEAKKAQDDRSAALRAS